MSEMAIKDWRGERCGLLTCLEPTRQKGKDGYTLWRCKCDCGNECLVSSAQLSRGDRKSCGCLLHPAPRDLLGQRFGALVVTGYEGKQGRCHLWRCRCDCGNEAVVRQANLVTGHTKSCGCRQRQTYRDNMQLVDGTSVTMIERRMESPIQSNTSGYNGVYWNARSGRWRAQITFKGKTYYLGSFADIKDAVKARRRGEEIFDAFLDWYYAQERGKNGCT